MRLRLIPILAVAFLFSLLVVGCDNSTRTQTVTEEPPPPTEPDEDAWPDDVTWTQVWGDEFDYDGALDRSKWRFETGGHGWGNQELQHYTGRTTNARANGDHLIIEARREDYADSEYTSARVNSTESWTYGRFEIRARLPEGLGTWPALWMLASQDVYGDAYWPDNGEIDIMEHVGYDPGVVHATVHTEAYNHIQNTQVGASMEVPDATTDFNVYAVEWTPDAIRAFINGESYFRFANERETSAQATYREWPFDQPFHLLMNIAVGGTWGGAQGVDPDVFPQTMAIDYVRVYQPESLVD